MLACWLGSMCFTKANAAFARPPSYLDTLLMQYTREHAPLTPYAMELVAALRSVDADLANATTPVLRPAGSRTVPVHPIGFHSPGASGVSSGERPAMWPSRISRFSPSGTAA